MITKMGRDLQNIDDDIARAKRLIKEKLLKDSDVIDFLHNEELERAGAEPDDYFNTNIFPFIRIPGTVDKVKNFICFAVDDIEEVQYNEVMKVQQICFVVFCHGNDINTGLGVPRHDIIGFLLRDIFNWSNFLGMSLKLVFDEESVTDDKFSCRTLRFQTTKPSSLYRGTMRPSPRINDEVDSHGIIRN